MVDVEEAVVLVGAEEEEEAEVVEEEEDEEIMVPMLPGTIATMAQIEMRMPVPMDHMHHRIETGKTRIRGVIAMEQDLRANSLPNQS